jgi:ribonuclease MRP protein subunit RMP1
MAISTKMSPPPSTLGATALLLATPHDKAMLLDVHDLLNKIFIRNVNQHRRSVWWKSLHAFRKQLALLLLEMEHPKKSEVEGKLEARLRYWDDKFVHTWY